MHEYRHHVSAAVFNVLLHWCSTCKAAFGIKLTQVDCLPDTILVWDLRLQLDWNTISLWRNSILQQYALMSYYTKHILEQAFLLV